MTRVHVTGSPASPGQPANGFLVYDLAHCLVRRATTKFNQANGELKKKMKKKRKERGKERNVRAAMLCDIQNRIPSIDNTSTTGLLSTLYWLLFYAVL